MPARARRPDEASGPETGPASDDLEPMLGPHTVRVPERNGTYVKEIHGVVSQRDGQKTKDSRSVSLAGNLSTGAHYN